MVHRNAHPLQEEMLWGIQVERTIRRLEETAMFSFTPKLERGGVARYGHLTGIRGIGAGRRLEILPYVGVSAEYIRQEPSPQVTFANPYRSGSDYFGRSGVDLKYRLGPNLTLDATANPDFGQVEVDPAVINLTAFETRFQERRPFFVAPGFSHTAEAVLQGARAGLPRSCIRVVSAGGHKAASRRRPCFPMHPCPPPFSAQPKSREGWETACPSVLSTR